MSHELVETLCADPPKLFQRKDGTCVSFSVSSSLLTHLDSVLKPEMRTLETGAGVSTVLFAAKGTQHIAIAPSEPLWKNIAAYCGEQDISVAGVRFEAACSETFLPSLETEPLDLILIDGRHAFPTPFIDWYYAERHLKVGGLLVLDDTHLWPPCILSAFLEEEPGWTRLDTLERRSTIFQKTAEGSHLKLWQDQPFCKKHSHTTKRNLLHGMDLLRTRQFKALYRALRRSQK